MNTRYFRITLLTAVVCVCGAITAADTGDSLNLRDYPVRFVVLGDRTGGHEPGVFTQIVQEADRLKPDFVITVGDMIEGYTEDSTELTNRWEEFMRVVEPLSSPIYYTPGNNDITSDGMLDHYLRYAGQPYYSFDHRGLHFTILDNSRWDYRQGLPSEQIDWLIDDLKEHSQATCKLVFLHKPFWYETVARGDKDTLHTLFVEYGVDAVFSGHYHRYFVGEFDGVTYTGIGSSGGHQNPNRKTLDYHFAWVTADDKQIHVAPILKDAIVPWDTYLATDLHHQSKLDRLSITLKESVIVSPDLSVENQSFSISIHNPDSIRSVIDTLVWTIPEAWIIEPVTTPISILPGATQTLEFQAQCNANIYPVPSLSAFFPLLEDRKYKVSRNLRLARRASCIEAPAVPTIDGDLSESFWQDARTALLGPDGASPVTDSVAFFFAYDRENLYLGARCLETNMGSIRASVSNRDGAVYSDDCVGYLFQPDTAVSTVFQIYLNPSGVIFDQRITFDERGHYSTDKEWSCILDVVTAKDVDFWSVEVRIPLRQFGLAAQPGDRWGLNFRRKQQRLSSSANWLPHDYKPESLGILEFR